MFSGNSEIVHFFAGKEQINLNAKDKWGRTPLMIAAIKGRIGAIRSLARKVDINLTDNVN